MIVQLALERNTMLVQLALQRNALPVATCSRRYLQEWAVGPVAVAMGCFRACWCLDAQWEEAVASQLRREVASQLRTLPLPEPVLRLLTAFLVTTDGRRRRQ